MRILSLDGGGILGLATASFLAECERHLQFSFHEKFDLFCGTSTGAIIALGLANGMKAAEIRDWYCELGPKIFKQREGLLGLMQRSRFTFFNFVVSQARNSKFTNQELIKALDTAFGDTTLKDLFEGKKKRVCIPSFCLTEGRPRIFKTDHSPDLSRHGGYRLAEIALASAAAPVYLPVVQIKSPTEGVIEEFTDGGIFANHPALIGYAEAVHHLKVEPSKVSILSVSTPRTNLKEKPSMSSDVRELSRGWYQWSSRYVQRGIDGTAMITDEVLRRIIPPLSGKTNYQRILLENTHSIAIDSVKESDYDELKREGVAKGSNNQIRDLVIPFLN